MGLLKRLMNAEPSADAPGERATTLAASARPMRVALLGLSAEQEQRDPGRPEVDLRAIATALLGGDVAPPTADVARLVSTGVDPSVFYEKELARSWELLNEAQRAARVEQFAALAQMLEDADGDSRPPNYEQMLASVRTKMLLLAFAFDETYGYVARIGRDEQIG
jgi:hypothetical protein